jgi:hypothetical protein
MTQEESKQRILQEWEIWAKDPNKPDDSEMRKFYDWLENNQPELLKWKMQSGVTYWQYVQGWLRVRTNYGHS